MRIVAGTARGRRFTVPSGRSTRPTSERAREAMFSTLGTLLDLDGIAVLDLYAGSGALGLEALSRGARLATFVESDRSAAAGIAASARELRLPHADVRSQTVKRFVERDQPAAYDLVFADPPYDLPAEELTAALLALTDRIVPGGIVVVERSSRDPKWYWRPPFEGVRVRRYGEGTLWYGRRP